MDSSATTSAVNPEAAESGVVKSEEVTAAAQPEQAQTQKWPGWPGDNVFRLVVPLAKVGSIIGRKGELVKKMSDETRARIRVLDGPLTNPDRIVLISGKEEPDSALSPAMDAVLRVFKRVCGLAEGDGTVPATAMCSAKLIVASSQAINLIGKQGSTIKSIQESTGAVVRILQEGELPSYAGKDERVVEIHGEVMKVLKALEAVTGQLRKFLVDHSVVPVFEQNHNATISKDQTTDSLADKSQPSFLSAPAPAPQSAFGSDYSLSLKRDPSVYDPEAHFDPKITQSGFPPYGQEPGLGLLRSMGLGRPNAPIVTQMSQTMQVPLSYAEDIIGVGGSNIAYIRRTSGAILTIQESRGLADEITIEIKGTATQVQLAQRLIQEFITNHKETVYGKIDAGLGSYPQGTDSSYPPPSFGSHLGGYGASNVGGYGSPGVGGYNSYRF
ncbi:hypothetical protein Tsubulata_025876 [Turnera subulata]|uniref:K Homology domain-containing protein n=1 Tax=Turnera subulata TaxID=218843 RepID=A0A9Q0GDW9_9ROSI|nr:hypothetical protein Tsubulata_025876 [Turnera subulata]